MAARVMLRAKLRVTNDGCVGDKVGAGAAVGIKVFLQLRCERYVYVHSHRHARSYSYCNVMATVTLNQSQVCHRANANTNPNPNHLTLTLTLTLVRVRAGLRACLRDSDHGAGDRRRPLVVSDRGDHLQLAGLPSVGTRLRQPGRAAHGTRTTVRLGCRS